MKQHLLSASLAAVAATTASLAVQQTTFHTIPQPTIINVSSRVPAEDMISLRFNRDSTVDPDEIAEYVVPGGSRLVIVGWNVNALRIDGEDANFYSYFRADAPLRHVGRVVQPGSVVSAGTVGTGSQPALELIGYLEDIP